MSREIRVIVVDDSPLIRNMFTSVLERDPDITVVATAEDPLDAREKMKQLNPDVITRDIEMPKMDGISFLEKIMALRPMPVVMASSLTQKGASMTIRALEIGAVDFIAKSGSAAFDVDAMGNELVAKVKQAAFAKVCAKSHGLYGKAQPLKGVQVSADKEVIAIGASTGGVEALHEVITRLPKNTPPVMVVQHMPAQFTKSLAQRLDAASHVTVKEAEQRDYLKHGHVYIAPGSHHLCLGKDSDGFHCRLNNGDLVSGHKPSADVLFKSVAEKVGKAAVGVILTGMGRDGAEGLLQMKEAGASTIGQNEESCVVYGMPKAAHLAGAVGVQCSVYGVAKEILREC